jgi:solute carrier family 35 protein C2
MDRSHRRSASTATADPNHGDTHNIRTRSHPDAISETSSRKKRRDEDAGSDGSDMTSSEDFEMDAIASDDGLEDDEETGLTGHDRQKRRRRKRRNTHMDQRIAPGSESQREEEDRLANKTFWSAVMLNALFIGLWYAQAQL